VNQKSAKKMFRDLRDAVSTAFRRHDPIGLIGQGAPLDEYDPEVGTVLPRLRSARSDAELRTILHEEFVRWFGAETAGHVEIYDAPAKEIWEYWLLIRARELSGASDAEFVDTSAYRVRYDQDVLEPRRVLRIGPRYFVEAGEVPGRWWIGELDDSGQIAVWGEYGSHEEAFSAH
jgi:hypothetical protein